MAYQVCQRAAGRGGGDVGEYLQKDVAMSPAAAALRLGLRGTGRFDTATGMAISPYTRLFNDAGRRGR